MSKFTVKKMRDRLALSDIGRGAQGLPTENMDLGWCTSYLREVMDLLDELDEYFDDRADAEYFPDRAEPVGNEEMRLLVKVRSIAEKLK